ncbi:hypothetical protein Nepgr_012521 [Nepenthes gracilis]|uniref:Uncharacterized protein n=1 Tax=Nepenthes gracilis TaxID=150966 RepID=A0AAD3XNF1_NEPGR|nr:hypothetical protein Nepgr_012521 [Nepenthes gracilis]
MWLRICVDIVIWFGQLLLSLLLLVVFWALGSLFLLSWLPIFPLLMTIVAAAQLLYLQLAYLTIHLYQFIARIDDDDHDDEDLQASLKSLDMSILLYAVVFPISSWTFWFVLGEIFYCFRSPDHVIFKWRYIKWLVVFTIVCAFSISWTMTRAVLRCAMQGCRSRILARFAGGLKQAFDCVLFFWWLIRIIKIFPRLKRHTILGLQTQKWTEIAGFVLCGCIIVAASTRLLVDLLQARYRNRKKVVYLAKGLQRNIKFTLISIFLLVWASYSHSYPRGAKANKIFELGTKTFLSLLTSALLWLVKTCVLLCWEAGLVYNRLGDRILRTGTQLYCLAILDVTKLGILSYGEGEGIGVPQWRGQWRRDDWKMFLVPPDLKPNALTKKLVTAKKKKEKREAREILVETVNRVQLINPPAYELKQMSNYFLAAQESLSKDDDFTYFCQQWCQLPDCSEQMRVEDLKQSIKVVYGRESKSDDINILYAQLQEMEDPSSVSCQYFLEWIATAHKDCLDLAHALSNSKAVVHHLNKLASGILTAVIVTVWLLLTIITTTRVFALVTSMIVAATLVLGYAMIRLDVGGLYDIDATQEVKLISMLPKRTMWKVDAKDEELRPMSGLANQHLANHKGNSDLADSV